MSSIVKAVSDLAASLVELVWSFFTTAGHLVQNTASFAAKFASEIIELILNFFKGLVDLAGGIVSFLVGELETDCLTHFRMLTVYEAMSSCSLFWLLPSSASFSTSAARVARSRLATRS
jgi:hypothetical protein